MNDEQAIEVSAADRWGDGDLVMVTWRENGGLSQWVGRIVGERMGSDGAKPHHIEGAKVTIIEKFGLNAP